LNGYILRVIKSVRKITGELPEKPKDILRNCYLPIALIGVRDGLCSKERTSIGECLRTKTLKKIFVDSHGEVTQIGERSLTTANCTVYIISNGG
jgi:hypothetical protein